MNVAEEPDFLDIDNGSMTQTQKGHHADAVAFAKLYVEAFVLNPSGRQLLAQWDSALLRKRVPVNATVNEYVWAESRRAFVQEILQQIEFAQSEGRLTR